MVEVVVLGGFMVEVLEDGSVARRWVVGWCRREGGKGKWSFSCRMEGFVSGSGGGEDGYIIASLAIR